MLEKNFAAGQCLCGEVKFTISSAPLRMAQCHCDDCKKITGTGHASIAFFNKDQVDISGETKSYASVTDSGSTITRCFCPTCGSRLFGANSKSESIIGVSVGTLEDSSWFKPDLIVYNKRKPGWDFMDTSVPVFEEMPV
ncbi:MAG: Gfa-like protein [Methylococcaceae bacterium]|nr:Gfa-like protein [Methylococcaceae bacterium]